MAIEPLYRKKREKAFLIRDVPWEHHISPHVLNFPPAVDTKMIFFISDLTIYKKLNRCYKRRQSHQATVHSFIYSIDRIN